MSFTKDQIFLVTGASSGIGQGVALKLNELGATVIAIARRQDKLEETRSTAKYPENFFCEPKDLTENIEALPSFVKSIKDKYGKLQGMAYCAGIDEIIPLKALDIGDMKKLFDINYFAPIFMLKGFADRRVNNGKSSACVFISSTARVTCDRGMITYSGSKAGLSASLKSASRELSWAGIRVNSISPTIIETEMTSRLPYMETKRSRYPLGFGKVSDISEMVAFMLSNESKWITGQDYIFDCGAI